jgi:mannose-1-phosphate guanylyltransferase/mannose-1-phosphate guanylyltransferase/mannose-6-phosphate isomerase
VDDSSLFQRNALRLTTSAQVTFDKPVTITNCNFRFIVADQLQAAGIEPGSILIELEGNNTAPAVLAACYYALRNK